MKKTLLLVVTLLLSANIYCQDDHAVAWLSSIQPYIPPKVNENDNVLYLSLAGAPPSIGLRYDRYFGRIGTYLSAITGKYPGGDDIQNRQIRYSLGGVYRLDYIRDQIDSPIATVGLVYHDWLSEDYVPGQLDADKAFRKFSFELGMGGRIGRFNVAGRADFMQFEVMVDAGFNF